MRRLVIEIPIEEMTGGDAGSPLRMIETAEIVHMFKQERGEFEAIVRVVFKDPNMKIENLFPGVDGEYQLLNEDAKSGVRTYFVKVKARHPTRRVFTLGEVSGGYISLPFEIMEGKVRMNFIGSPQEVKKFTRLIDKSWPSYRVISLTDAKFSPDSPLGCPTEKQRGVLLTAFNLGYYDLPRRIDSRELAKRLNIRGSALIAHRRKAERRILAKIING
jgi:HTH DNA binding domain